MSFSDFPFEVLALILDSLSWNDLGHSSSVSKLFAAAFKSDYLWNKKILTLFGPVQQYKPCNETSLEQYWYLSEARDRHKPNREVKRDRIDALVFLVSQGLYPESYYLDLAAERGALLTLQVAWPNANPTIRGANSAAQKGHLQVLDWIQWRTGILPDVEGANRAAENGHREVLLWLNQRHIRPNKFGANEAAVRLNLPILDLLASWGILPSSFGFASVVDQQSQELINWMLVHNVEADWMVANEAAEAGDLATLRRIAPVLPDSSGCNAAASEGHLPVLDWLAEHGCYPDRTGVSWAAGDGHLHVLQWMEEHRPWYDAMSQEYLSEALDGAAGKGDVHTVQQIIELSQLRVVALDRASLSAVYGGHFEVFKILFPLGSGLQTTCPWLRDESILSYATRLGRTEIIKFLLEQESQS